ncbi:glycogen-binding domain-containing protein [Gemmatimonas phototrophica]|uniref:AMP-activated protein kinase glycogen-binding domain-containing protein n=1 Tax=Gemmatimonas phototrophica TaxID=1379270 RepID=A0A143BKF9_9BACT|nr:glycogen-binding domain-containing protein [Gemmatimonas phototrophica]AMW05557.1 hypothetical protein GEMMAAP_13550 [Gemmatimonas phototrophica]
MAPAATIGPVTDAATFSVLGIASLPNGSGNTLARSNDVWLGATQPVGSLGRFRFAALGSGNVQFKEGVAGGGQAQGLLTMRARARFGEQRVWSAVSYGRSSINGQIAGSGFGNPMLTGFIAPSMPAEPSVGDTTITRRVDVGQLGRAEAGMVTTYAGVEFAFGMSFERATRVTTQTLTVDVPRVAVNVPNSAGQLSGSSSTLRTMQRRDLATGIASAGFNTGQTQWLLSVTAPVASWINSDALAPRPQTIPTVATLAVVQPVTGWLSLVGAAATNAATVGGGSMLSDQLRDRARSAFSPVVALGVRISRLPWRDNDGTPAGILAFETRTLGAVDRVSIEQGNDESGDAYASRDTLRVVLLIDAPKAESVELMGDATQWSITQMRRLPNGRWRAELKLSPGMHRVTVRADGGQWIAPPGLPIGNDEYGSPVGMIIVRR